MNIPKIKAAVVAVRNIRGLPSNQDFQKMDLLQTCSIFFSIALDFSTLRSRHQSQRAHLILLLANVRIQHTQKQTSISKLGDGVVDELMRKLFLKIIQIGANSREEKATSVFLI